jgi:hypothetical protein
MIHGLTPKQEQFVLALKRQIEDGAGLEVDSADRSVGFGRRYHLAQRFFVVPRGGVEIDFLEDYLELEIDFLEALVLVSARFNLEDGDELVTVELTLEEILEVWDA